jgi:pilus assembly protein CpaF
VIVEAEARFRDEAHIMNLVEKIIAPLNKRIDESSPMVDARLPAGYRVNVIIPPLAVKSPSITIRKFFNERVNVDYLVTIGTLTPEVAEFLRACVEGRLNLLICGGTGTGKTTMLNALSAFIPERERVITIEDPAELQLKRKHVVSLETRPPNIEGKNQVTQRELLINALRMRPDRIVVGEVRGGEAFDMLQAMNTGHDGSICTVHANTPRDALARVENMVLMAGFELPIRAIREQVASAIHAIVHLSRLRDGKRRISQISEVVGMEETHITMQDIFVFEQTGMDADGQVSGSLQPTGIRPRFMDRLEEQGFQLNPMTFRKTSGW